MKTVNKAIVEMLTVMLFCASCTSFGSHHNIQITVSEADRQYSIVAHYPEEETRKVEDYLTQNLGKESHVSFANARIDADFTLDDGTTFYMKNEPGNLLIKLDKDKNDAASYQQIKTVGSGLKDILK